MKKTAWGVAVVAVAAIGYAGASWTIGQQIEQRYTDEYDRALSMLGVGNVISHDYERGWFTSVGHTVIEFEVPEELFGVQHPATEPPAETDPDIEVEPKFRTVRLHLEDRVRHGPLPGWRIAAATIESRLTEVEGIDDATRQAFAGAKAPYLNTLFAFGGSYHGDFVLPAGEVRQPKLVAQWQQFDSTVDGTADTNRVKGKLNWPQMTMTPTAVDGTPADSIRIVMRGMTGDFEMDQPQDGQPWMSAQGTYKGRIEEISLRRVGDGTSAEPPLLACNDMQLHSNTTLDGALLNMKLNLTSRGSVGGLAIDSLRLDSTLDRLDLEAMNSLKGLMQPAADPIAPNPDAQAGPEVNAVIEQLLVAKPAYAVKFTAALGGQDGEFGYRLAVVDAPNQASSAFPPGMPPNLLLLSLLSQRVEGDANLLLPKSWLPAIANAVADPKLSVQSMKTVLDGLVAQRMLVADAQGWRADLKLKQGAVLLNGQPFKGMGPMVR
ncbi:MAG: DUF945 family protein [Burkholderiales bacterium]